MLIVLGSFHGLMEDTHRHICGYHCPLHDIVLDDGRVFRAWTCTLCTQKVPHTQMHITELFSDATTHCTLASSRTTHDKDHGRMCLCKVRRFNFFWLCPLGERGLEWATTRSQYGG